MRFQNFLFFLRERISGEGDRHAAFHHTPWKMCQVSLASAPQIFHVDCCLWPIFPAPFTRLLPHLNPRPYSERSPERARESGRALPSYSSLLTGAFPSLFSISFALFPFPLTPRIQHNPLLRHLSQSGRKWGSRASRWICGPPTSKPTGPDTRGQEQNRV